MEIEDELNQITQNSTNNTNTETPKELLQHEVISHLLNSDEYFKSVLPFLEEKYFDEDYRVILSHIREYHKEYKNKPSIKELILTFKDSPKKHKEIIRNKGKELINPKPINKEFLVKLTEDFIKQEIFKEAIIKGADSLGSNNKEGFIESYRLVEEFAKVSLSSDVGISLTETEKLDFSVKKGILTGIQSFDRILGTGFQKGTLNVAMAPSGIGKTATLIAFACEFLKQKEDIVFISLEQNEAEIYKRIYANLLEIDVNLIHEVDPNLLKEKIQKLDSSLGNIFVKQYPAKSISPMGIASYLEILETEKGIKSPIVVVDYLGLLKSDYLKNMDNSYQYIGSVAEELRSVAIMKDLVIFSPMQLNRSAYGNLEAGSESLSDSMKVYHTADTAFLILQTQDMKDNNTVRISFVKNRISGITSTFEIKFNYQYFRFEDKFFIDGENITEHKNSPEEVSDFETGIASMLI